MAKRKPAKLSLAEGDKSKLGRHKLAQLIAQIPEGLPGAPDCPPYLKGRARDVWQKWTLDLIRMRLDAQCDGEMLEGACIAYAHAVEADLQIAREGVVLRWTTTRNGKPVEHTKKNPAFMVSCAAWQQVRSFCSEFGFSPASRARLSVPKVNETREDIEAMLRGPSLTPAEKLKFQ